MLTSATAIVNVVGEFMESMVTPPFYVKRRHGGVYYWNIEHDRYGSVITIYLNDNVLIVRGWGQYEHKSGRLNLADPDCFEQVERLYQECVLEMVDRVSPITVIATRRKAQPATEQD